MRPAGSARAAPVLTPAFLSRLPGLRLKAKAVLEGALAGQHRSPFHGYSSEFAQYRGYVPGDDMRFLDWKVFGRRDQLVTRQYRDETNTAVHLLVDTSASMGYRAIGPSGKPDPASPTKLETACTLAAALALLAGRQRDTVALAHGGDKLDAYRPPAGGAHAVDEVLQRLEGLSAGGRTDLKALFAQLAARLAGQSFVFLFTDLWQDPAEIAAGLRHVRRKSRAVTVVQLRTRDEEEFFTGDAVSLRDLETGAVLEVAADGTRVAYIDAVRAHARRVAAECAALDLRLAVVRTDEPLDGALRRMLG